MSKTTIAPTEIVQYEIKTIDLVLVLVVCVIVRKAWKKYKSSNTMKAISTHQNTEFLIGAKIRTITRAG